MSDRSQMQALLREAKQLPHDDGPRLVLADWLQENGPDEDARALGEFLYLQCRLAATPEDDRHRRHEWWQRQEALRQQHLKAWLGPWSAWFQRHEAECKKAEEEGSRTEGMTWWFDRGLLWLHLRGARWLDGLGDDPAAWTWVEGLRVSALAAAELDSLLAAPCLEHLGVLDLGGNGLGDDGASALAGCAHLAGLAVLHLRFNGLGGTGARFLADSPHLAGLTALHLGGNAVGNKGTRALANTPTLANLTRLELWSNSITADGAHALAGSPHLGRLTLLDLKRNDLDDPARQALRERFGDAVIF
jgi:uncharacterized protein (TIGR02996 family)